MIHRYHVWSRRWELNPWPARYECAALPLSYVGEDRGMIPAFVGSFKGPRLLLWERNESPCLAAETEFLCPICYPCVPNFRDRINFTVTLVLNERFPAASIATTLKTCIPLAMLFVVYEEAVCESFVTTFPSTEIS